MNAVPSWSTREDAILRQAIREGWSPTTLRAALPGHSMSAIASRAKRLALPISRTTGVPLRQQPTVSVDCQIEAILYVKNDSVIAAYLGTSRERVAAVRAARGERKIFVKGAGHGSTGATSAHDVLAAAGAARTGSDSLRDACARLFHRVAQRDGITFEAAMRACLYPPAGGSGLSKEMIHAHRS